MKTNKHGFPPAVDFAAVAARWRCALAVLVLALLGGCAATLHPPPTPEHPAPVYVLDHGRHNSLVLVVESDRVMRFAFGEWRWYVDGETGMLRSVDALLRSTPAALGRMRLAGPPEPDCWVDQVGSEIRQVLLFSAEEARVHRLADRLDEVFAQSESPPYYSQLLNLEFIIDARSYSLRYNSNHQVIAWLEELGFEVSGSPALGWLRPGQAGRSLSADSSRCSALTHSDSSDS